MFGSSTFSQAPFSSQAGEAFAVSLSEAITCAEINTVYSEFVLATQENVVLNSDILPTTIFIAALSDTYSVSELYSAQTDFLSDVTESAQFTTVESGARSIPVAFDSGSQFTSSITGDADYPVDIAHSILLSADADRGITAFRTVDEALLTDAVVDIQVAFSPIIDEGVQAQSTTVVQVDFVSTQSEHARLSAPLTAQADFIVGMQETASLTAAITRRYLWELIDNDDSPSWQTIDTI